MRHFSTKMTHCAVPEILVNLYSMLGSSWNSIALGLNESSFWPYDYHFTNFLEKLIVLCIFRDIFCNFVFQLLLQKSTFSHKVTVAPFLGEYSELLTNQKMFLFFA